MFRARNLRQLEGDKGEAMDQKCVESDPISIFIPRTSRFFILDVSSNGVITKGHGRLHQTSTFSSQEHCKTPSIKLKIHLSVKSSRRERQ
jgi:hypothetical protein